MQSANAADLLQFQDYSAASNSSTPAQISVNSPTHSADTAATAGGRKRGDPLSELIYDMSNSANVLSGSGKMNTDASGGAGAGDGSDEETRSTTVSFLTMEYYQQFFNVDTYMVLDRIANSMIPKRASEGYLRGSIGKNPDLYGPFWIIVTLIFSIAISGNIASYLQYRADEHHWHYNFRLVSYAATCIFIYANFVPAAMWAILKYSLKPVDDIESENASYTPSLLSLMCIYGYSLSIYIPVSILWTIQISLLQWLLVITAAFLSGTVLIIVLTPALRNSRYALFLIIGILSAHFMLAAGFMLYFFHTSSAVAEVSKSLPIVKEVTTHVIPAAPLAHNT